MGSRDRLRNRVGLALLILSVGLLFPGLLLPMFHLTITGQLITPFGQMDGVVLDNVRSILGTVQDLWNRDRFLVSSLIFLFSAGVPLVKAILLGIAVSGRLGERSKSIKGFVGAISKWSMADVFVVAILLAYLATVGHGERVAKKLNVMGMAVPVEYSLTIHSQIKDGFYYFLGYCLVSILAVQVLKLSSAESQ